MPFVKLARRHEERNSRLEIVPNPLEGVNTHLWSNEAYIVGIVPHPTPFYTTLRTETRHPENPEAVGVVSGKSKMSFPRNLIRWWREVFCIY